MYLSPMKQMFPSLLTWNISELRFLDSVHTALIWSALWDYFVAEYGNVEYIGRIPKYGVFSSLCVCVCPSETEHGALLQDIGGRRFSSDPHIHLVQTHEASLLAERRVHGDFSPSV